MKEIQTQKKAIGDIEISFTGVKDTDILLFTKYLYVALKSGMTLSEGLKILIDQGKGKVRKMTLTILNIVESGASFHKALEKFPKYFSPIYINMVKSGEISGNLEENLKRLTIEMEKSIKLKKKIKGAMIYPTIIFIGIFGLGMAVALFILPKILPLFNTLDVELPLTTRGLIYVAELFETQGIILVISVIIFVSLFIWIVRQNFIKPFTHWIILKVPVVKTLILNINVERFTRTFGILLGSGLTIDQSLQILAEGTENRVYQKSIKEMIPIVESGSALSIAIQKHPKLFPPITSRMIGVGERTGNLDNTLKYLAGFYEELVDNTTKNLSTIIEPVMLIIIGIVVGTVAISILGPIYEITGNLRS